MKSKEENKNKNVQSNKNQIQETALHKALKQHIIVDPNSENNDPGITQTKTIQEAIDLAQEGGIIKIVPGLYKENIYINKGGLRLEPKDKQGNIILFGQKKSVVTVDLKHGEKCFIFGIKLCHTGFNQEDMEIKKDDLKQAMENKNMQKEQTNQMDTSIQNSMNNSMQQNNEKQQQQQNSKNNSVNNLDNFQSQIKTNNFLQSQQDMNSSPSPQKKSAGNLRKIFQMKQFQRKFNNKNQFDNMNEKQLMEESKKLSEYFTENNVEAICQSITPVENLMYQFQFDINMNAVILLWGGKLFLEDCTLSLNFLLTTFQQLMPCIALNSNSDIVINRCEIKGNKKQPTIGVLMKNSDALIKDSYIHSHMLGGIYIWSKHYNKIKITNNKIINCMPRGTGIYCGGIDSPIVIEGNELQQNFIGIHVGIANQAQIIKNKLHLNSFGIEAVSSDPFIFNNIIEKNLIAGILTRTYDNIRCDGVIKRNECIRCNKEYGIICQGQNNYTKIEKNEDISFNKKCGVKVEDQAHIFIHRNNIFKNLGQGILIVETASAVVEKNSITENLKANIALGGLGSQDSLIAENIISGGRCEGIFLIDAGECWIMRNQIFENNDGIIMVTSVPRIENNQIVKNKSNGVMAIKDSRPHMENNLIEHNAFIGLFIRDKSHGIYKGNMIQGNKQTNLLVEKRIKSLENILQQNQVCYPKHGEDEFTSQELIYNQEQQNLLQQSDSERLNTQASQKRMDFIKESQRHQKKAVSRFGDVEHETYRQREERKKKYSNNNVDGDIRIPQNYSCNLI